MNTGDNGQIYPTDAVGSLTNHIMWTKSLQSGGVVGETSLKSTATPLRRLSILHKIRKPIIDNGYIYYTEPLSYTDKAGASNHHRGYRLSDNLDDEKTPINGGDRR